MYVDISNFSLESNYQSCDHLPMVTDDIGKVNSIIVSCHRYVIFGFAV